MVTNFPVAYEGHVVDLECERAREGERLKRENAGYRDREKVCERAVERAKEREKTRARTILESVRAVRPIL